MATEAEYDEIIAPMLADVARRCEVLGMSMVARVEWAPDEAGLTKTQREEASASQRMASIAAFSRGNVDAFCLEMVRRFDVSNSIFLRKFAEPDNAR